MYSMSPNDTEMIEKQLNDLEIKMLKLTLHLKCFERLDVENLKLSSKNSELLGLKLINDLLNLGEFKVTIMLKQLKNPT